VVHGEDGEVVDDERLGLTYLRMALEPPWISALKLVGIFGSL
jgi:hypothetical protein